MPSWSEAYHSDSITWIFSFLNFSVHLVVIQNSRMEYIICIWVIYLSINLRIYFPDLHFPENLLGYSVYWIIHKCNNHIFTASLALFYHLIHPSVPYRCSYNSVFTRISLLFFSPWNISSISATMSISSLWWQLSWSPYQLLHPTSQSYEWQ